MCCRGGAVTLIGCTFVRSRTSSRGSDIAATEGASIILRNCTSYEPLASEAIFLGDASHASLEECIIAFGIGCSTIECSGGSDALLACCDFFGNVNGDWPECIEDQYGVNGNISEDPQFCDPGSSDFTLQECSPCAPFSPPNPECDLIGAWPVGCGGTPTTRSTWGGVKALFKD